MSDSYSIRQMIESRSDRREAKKTYKLDGSIDKKAFKLDLE